jgi:hypothetical protein
VRGDADPSTVTLGMVVAIVRAAERHFDDAAAKLAVAPIAGPDRQAAQEGFDAAAERLDAALNRRDRFISELGKERWLWVAGPADEVSFG